MNGLVDAQQENIILLVDDSQENLDALNAMLEGSYKVYSTKNGRAALRIMEKIKPDLVLLDVVMPEMNGRELARQLVALQPRIKLLFMSGFTANVIASADGGENGAGFLQKPFSRFELAAKIRATLDAPLGQAAMNALDDVAAFAQLAQRRLSVLRYDPLARTDLVGETERFQLA